MTDMSQGVARGPRASFWQRLGALIVDSIVLWIVGIVLFVISRGAGYGLGTLISLGYYVYFEGGSTGQTLGKRALGIRVYDFEGSGGPIGYGRGFIRWLGKIVSAIPCLLGFFWVIWDKEKQGWHDKLARTVVVPVSDYPINN